MYGLSPSGDPCRRFPPPRCRGREASWMRPLLPSAGGRAARPHRPQQRLPLRLGLYLHRHCLPCHHWQPHLGRPLPRGCRWLALQQPLGFPLYRAPLGEHVSRHNRNGVYPCNRSPAPSKSIPRRHTSPRRRGRRAWLGRGLLLPSRCGPLDLLHLRHSSRIPHRPPCWLACCGPSRGGRRSSAPRWHDPRALLSRPPGHGPSSVDDTGDQRCLTLGRPQSQSLVVLAHPRL